ncbi:MAG: hypothetical protein OEY52_07210 [Gammaproteobacteria bacterium]|nr:hypothetical protein [Gammaproteobacteria bacterium]
MNKLIFVIASCFALLTNINIATATENVQVGGFVRAAGAVSDNESKYMERVDNKGDFGYTHFGMTVSADIDDRWSAAGQIFGTGAEENYAMVVDWAYVTFRAYEEVTWNMGKMKYPNLIVSEYYDIGLAYPWISPPEEVYRIEVLGPSLSYEAFSGAKINYQNAFGDIEVLASLYGGGTALEKEKMTNMGGAVLSMGTDSFKVRAAYNQSRLIVLPGSERESELSDKTQSVASFGLNFDIAGIVGYYEYAKGEVEDVDEVTTEASYFTLGYRFGGFMPHVTVAEFETENKLGQESIAYGIKYLMSPSASFKMEYKLIKPVERKDSEPTENPAGHFEEVPDEKEVAIFKIAVDVVF